MADFQNFRKVVEDVKSRFFIDTLKKEQEEALFNFVCKRDLLTCQLGLASL